jgi:predicted nucleic acid-binding protein
MANNPGKVFIDTDVCLDLLSGRKPFVKAAQALFSLAESEKIYASVSDISFANIDYLLRSQYSVAQSRSILLKFKTLVSVSSVDEKVIELALASSFNNFEDAIQHYCALNSQAKYIITRNIKDYKKS